MAQINKPNLYFNTVLYTGNGSTQSITGVGFQPDWVWVKERTSTSSHPFYFATSNAGSFAGEYTSGVTNSRATSGSVTITVPLDAPETLYYQCGNHSSMVGTISVYSPWVAVTAAN